MAVLKFGGSFFAMESAKLHYFSVFCVFFPKIRKILSVGNSILKILALWKILNCTLNFTWIALWIRADFHRNLFFFRAGNPTFHTSIFAPKHIFHANTLFHSEFSLLFTLFLSDFSLLITLFHISLFFHYIVTMISL